MPQIDPNEWLLSSGVRSAKFEKVGDSVVGHIFRQPEVRQQTDIKSGEPLVWPNGDPKMQLYVVLMTEQRDPEDPEDSGERAIYIKNNMQRAVATAVREANAKGLEIGGKLLIRFSGEGQATQRGFNAPKLYEAKYKAPAQEPVVVPEPPQDQVAASPALDTIPF